MREKIIKSEVLAKLDYTAGTLKITRDDLFNKENPTTLDIERCNDYVRAVQSQLAEVSERLFKMAIITAVKQGKETA